MAKKSKNFTTDQQFQTPMMVQYLELKQKYSDCILFFRLGDFYEMFLDDARIGAKILGITLTRRARGKDGDIPMAGVPYHAVDLYLPKLVDAGYKVAVAEQITSPKDTPNLVVRDVVRIVTAGTMIEGRSVNEKDSAFVCSIMRQKKNWSIACADLATGEFYLQTAQDNMLRDVLHHFQPKEIILSPPDYNNPTQLSKISQSYRTNIYPFHEWEQWASQAESVLCEQLQVSSLRGYGIEEKQEAIICAVLFGYLSYTQHGNITHIQSIQKIEDQHVLQLDSTTIESLELFTSSMDHSSEGSLLSAIDHTQTAMGARMLKRWLAQPLCERKPILHRLQDVEYFVSHPMLMKAVTQLLNTLTDLERQVSKLSIGIGTARDLIALRENVRMLKKISLLPEMERFKKSFSMIDTLEKEVITYLKQWIEDDPPGVTKIGQMIKAGNSEELDSLRSIYQQAQSWIQSFEQQEKNRTGIATLKVGFNSVFGFYIEISKAHANQITKEHGYERKQTLVNAERFITVELKDQEQKVLSARERADSLEFELFQRCVAHVLDFSKELQEIARTTAYLDCVTNFAFNALEHHYCKPLITSQKILSISNGRHPVVEQYLKDEFVPNSTEMSEKVRVALITGPNMAGKSTYIRQVALLVLLAHLGSYLPADQATIPVCDRIFSRIGASDALHKGLSTFMVEMTETAKILHHATEKSFIIFDEIGRGTGVNDGLAIAQAVAEYVAVMPEHPFVFFATHYHQLAQLANHFKAVKNFTMTVQMHKGKMIFLRTLEPGNSDHSYGIEVAKEAGIPIPIVKRAEALRSQLSIPSQNQVMKVKRQKSGSETEKKIARLVLNELSPKEAWEWLEREQVKITQ